MPHRHRSPSLSAFGIIAPGYSSWRWLRGCLAVCLALTCLPSHAMATLEVPARTCSPLLMAAECDQYHQRLRQAASETQRRQITLEYEAVVNERQRFCPLLLVSPAKALSLGIARPGE